MSILSRAWRRSRVAGEGVHELSEDALLPLPRGRGLVLRVESGEVVVTRAGDPEDHVLGAGASLDLGGYDRAVAWALRSSRLALRRIPERADVPAEPLLAR